MDHAFGFFDNIKNIYKSENSYELFADMDGLDSNAKGVKKTKICNVFELKKKMVFLFDYGDEWIFLIECKEISTPIEKTKYPRLVEKVSKAPEQYPEYDDSEYEDEE